jgi:hypothetical protein
VNGVKQIQKNRQNIMKAHMLHGAFIFGKSNAAVMLSEANIWASGHQTTRGLRCAECMVRAVEVNRKIRAHASEGQAFRDEVLRQFERKRSCFS